jgi:hypothetical protein
MKGKQIQRLADLKTKVLKLNKQHGKFYYNPKQPDRNYLTEKDKRTISKLYNEIVNTILERPPNFIQQTASYFESLVDVPEPTTRNKNKVFEI